MQQQKAKMEDLHVELKGKLEAAQRELELVNRDCSGHKQRLAEVEVLNQRTEKELKSAMKEILVAREDNVANLSQVNQYRKEVDLLKTQVWILSTFLYLTACSQSVCLSVYIHVCLSIAAIRLSWVWKTEFQMNLNM